MASRGSSEEEKDRDTPGGIVKVQKSSNGRYSVTLPKEYVEEEGIEPGERVYVGSPLDGSSSSGILEPVRRLFRR